ncbi:MAG: hypothetical protein JSU63_16730 [Phycisphaerales bacterium]|nr:MAG: hypothetical protein JSU63_16730 [Phycisphaerales bacterium]
MWPLADPFEKNLRKCAQSRHVRQQPDQEESESTVDSIDADIAGFYTVRPDRLGELCALILAQAQSDGATRIKLHYSNNKMVYTIDGTDYDMVPCPSPSNVDLVRAIAKSSHLTRDKPGRMHARFADHELTFTVRHEQGLEDPYLEITGFTGEPRILSERTRAKTADARPEPE